uniref:Shell matrix protein n=1 Tax=Laqueus rubellus TaxID=93892 RepID=A0A3G9CLZ6_LAQRU
MRALLTTVCLSVFCVLFAHSQSIYNQRQDRYSRRSQFQRNRLGQFGDRFSGNQVYGREPVGLAEPGAGPLAGGDYRQLTEVDYFPRQMAISEATNGLLGQGVMCGLANGRLFGSQHALVDRKFTLSPEGGIITGFVYCDLADKVNTLSKLNNVYDAFSGALIAVALPGTPSHTELSTFITSDTRFSSYRSTLVRNIELLVKALKIKGVCIAYCGASVEDGNPVVADCSGNAYSGIAYVHEVDGIPIVFNRLSGEAVGALERISQLAAKESEYLKYVVSSIPLLNKQVDVIRSLNNGFVQVPYPANTILTGGRLSGAFQQSILSRQNQFAPIANTGLFGINDLLSGAFGRYSRRFSRRQNPFRRQQYQRRPTLRRW